MTKNQSFKMGTCTSTRFYELLNIQELYEKINKKNLFLSTNQHFEIWIYSNGRVRFEYNEKIGTAQFYKIQNNRIKFDKCVYDDRNCHLTIFEDVIFFTEKGIRTEFEINF